MLQDIRDKSQGIVVKIIVGFIVVTFALFGVDALVNSFTSSDTVASVDGKDISRTQMLQGAETQRRQLISMMNGQINPDLLEENLLQRRALDELIQRAVLNNQAAALGLGVSDEQVDSYIVQSEQFQTNGQFDQNRYLNFIQSLGFTPLAFKERIKEDVLIQQTRNAIAGSDFVLPYQVDAVASLQAQQRSYDYVTFSLADQSEQVTVNEDELMAYYEEHKDRFKTPEQVKINYVLLTSDDFADKVTVSSTELEQAYNAAVAGDVQEERSAAHILIETSDPSSEEAQQRLAEIEGKLSAGESFEELAAQYSDDIGSKNDGGNLGYVTKGSMGDAFEDKLFAMQEGEVAAVETEYGLHLIKLNEIVATDLPTLAELEDELKAQIVSAKARDALLSAHEDIIDLAYASDELGPLAKEYGLTVQESDYFTRTLGGDDITNNPQVIAAAYSPAVLEDGQNSDLIELDDDQVLVLRVNDHQAESFESYEQALSDVTSALVEQKALAELQVKAQAAITDPETVWTSVTNASRGQNELSSLAFSLAHPIDGPVTKVEALQSGDLAVIKLTAINTPEETVEDDQKQAYEGYLKQTQITLSTQSQQALLENAADIER